MGGTVLEAFFSRASRSPGGWRPAVLGGARRLWGSAGAERHGKRSFDTIAKKYTESQTIYWTLPITPFSKLGAGGTEVYFSVTAGLGEYPYPAG